MRKKNGFTLIELLAIIVILAIIAVITTPIILEIIDNSKKGAAKDSAYGYKDSISKFYISKLSDDPSYNIPNKVYTVSELKTSGVSVSGQEPGGNSWVQIENNKVVNGCLQFDEYKVDITNGELGNAEKDQCESQEPAPMTGEVLEDITKYIPGEIVYYNPIDGVYCNKETDAAINKYDPDNSIPEYKGVVPETNTLGQTKCLKWYKYSKNADKTVNILLDHNIEVGKQYFIPRVGAGTYGTIMDTSYGPVDMVQYLTLLEWEGVPTRSDKYTSYVNNNGTRTKRFTRLENNAVDYSGKKARLITAQEIAIITGADQTSGSGISWDEENRNSSWFYIDSKDQTNTRTSSNTSNYYWLYDNLYNCAQYGCINQDTLYSSGNYGYWTSTPNDSINVWRIGNDGSLRDVGLDSSLGVRPVITIPNN